MNPEKKRRKAGKSVDNSEIPTYNPPMKIISIIALICFLAVVQGNACEKFKVRKSSGRAQSTVFIPGTGDRVLSVNTDSLNILNVSDDTGTLPVVSAGDDIECCVHSSVILDGSNCNDPKGLSIAYKWFFNSKPPYSVAVLRDSGTPNAKFIPDLPGNFNITLVVTAADGRTASDQVVVAVNECFDVPVAVVEYDSVICSTPSYVEVDGTASFIENGVISKYIWSMVSKPEGSRSYLSGMNLPISGFIADLPGTYKVVLRVASNSNGIEVTSEEVQAIITVFEASPPEILPEGKSYTYQAALIKHKFIDLQFLVNEVVNLCSPEGPFTYVLYRDDTYLERFESPGGIFDIQYQDLYLAPEYWPDYYLFCYLNGNLVSYCQYAFSEAGK